MNRYVFVLLGVMVLGMGCVNGDNVMSHHDGAAFAKARKADMDGKGFLTEASARKEIKDTNTSPPEAGIKIEQLNGRRDPSSEASKRVKDQLSGNRAHIDPITDPMFVNANQAILDPAKTLKKQTMVVVDTKDATERTCIETRDEKFKVINYTRAHIHYKKFEVSQFYNHCPSTSSHCGWGKRNDCPNYQRNQSILKPTRHPEADYEEIVITWTTDAHPDFDALFNAGKCRLKKETSKEEGKESRMIPVQYYAKVEILGNTDWVITEIEEHRDERSRLRRPEDFKLDSFEKTQVYTCSYQSPGNTCKVLREQGAIEKESTCVKKMADVCVEWQKVMLVPKPGSTKTETHDLTEGHIEAFNADGRMNDMRYTENTESPEAIARLTALREVGAAMPKINTGDPEALSVFRGEDLRCVTQGGKWSHHGCPGQKGKKDPHEQKLERLETEGKCIKVGSYEKEDDTNIGMAIGQKATVTTFCCFENILSKVLHQGAITQNIKLLGEPKTPNCAALTLGQLQKMNWEAVDFTPFVKEVTSKVNLNPAQVGQRSANTVRAHLDNQMRGAKQQAQRKAGK